MQSGDWISEIAVIIPAFNEADSIAAVLADIPGELVAEIIVVDNGSSDATAQIAEAAGATVVTEDRRGYGYACARGVQYLANSPRKPDIVVFIDADYSDYPSEMTDLVKPIVDNGYDLVVGCRTKVEKFAMPPQQVLGNRLAVGLINLLCDGVRYHDLGPFRAIRYEKLIALDIQDRTYGWPVEMQVKAAKRNMRVLEVPVSYRARIGKSKISGTVRGTLLAGYKIITTILKYSR
jgi:glycosyltransferase involved in cell wall biosynthesis